MKMQKILLVGLVMVLLFASMVSSAERNPVYDSNLEIKENTISDNTGTQDVKENVIIEEANLEDIILKLKEKFNSEYYKLEEEKVKILENHEKGDVNLDGVIDINDLKFLINYKFNEGEVPEFLYFADYNTDGVVNLLDIIELIQYLKGKGIISEFQKGDVNQNGQVDVDDVYFLINYKFRYGEKPKDLMLADFNEDGIVNILDIIKMIDYLKEQGVIVNFQIGDVNKDGKIDLDDVYFLIDYKFRDGVAPDPAYLGDFNEDGVTNILDIIELIQYLKDNGIIETDTTAPVIKLIAPEDNDEFETSDGDRTIHFEFKISDESEISYCELVIDGKVYEKIENPQRDIVLELSVELEEDDYEWFVKCEDIYGNYKESNKWDFEIVEKKSDNKENEREGIFYTNKKDNDNFYSQNFEETAPIVIGQSEKTKVSFLVGYLIPIFLGLCIILLVIMVAISIKKRY